MQLNVSQTSTNSGGGSDIFGGIQSSALTWNPSTQGAITALDISVDWKGLSTGGSSYLNVYIFQNGLVYIDPYNSPFVGGLTGWNTQTGSAISSGDINFAFGADASGSRNYTPLNLSATGGLISFGFGVSEGSSGVISNSIGIDNFSVSVTTVPEPSTYALFGLGALALLIATRRKVA